MKISTERFSLERQLDRATKELKKLKEAKRLLSEETPIWKKASLTNHELVTIRRNTIIEESEICYPWYLSQEKDCIYETNLYLNPFTIKLIHQFNVKKPYEIRLISPLNHIIKTKRFKNIESAAAFTESLKTKVVKMHEKRITEIDTYIDKKKDEILIIERAINTFCSENNRNKRITKIS